MNDQVAALTKLLEEEFGIKSRMELKQALKKTSLDVGIFTQTWKENETWNQREEGVS